MNATMQAGARTAMRRMRRASGSLRQISSIPGKWLMRWKGIIFRRRSRETEWSIHSRSHHRSSSVRLR